MLNDKQNLPATKQQDIAEGELLPATVESEQAPEIETGFESPKKIGLGIAFVVFGLFGLWSVLAPIDSAAHAPGTIKVKSYNKVVQHLEGGIVREIRVQNGDQVEAGDVLLVMDPTQSQAQLEIQRSQLLALAALEARLMAEQQGLDEVEYPEILTEAGAEGQQEITAQNRIFTTRKDIYESTIAVLEQRIGQLESRIEGLIALRQSKSELARSFQEELDDFRPLLEEGFTDKQRLRQLERSLASYHGEAADLAANISATRLQINEAQQEILQSKHEFQNEVAGNLAEVQVNLKDTRERITALTDIVKRTEIRAPISGIVNNFQVHTEGGVINPGNPIAEIVPMGDDLIVEAMVSPLDIDRIAEGQTATIRFPAFNSKIVPTLNGNVLGISADAFTDDRSGASYYTARIQLSEQSIADLQELELVPGMPAEVFITTGSRTFLQYLLKPLSNAAARSFIED